VEIQPGLLPALIVFVAITAVIAIAHVIMHQCKRKKIREDFQEALKDDRATAKENNITEADIEAEIRAVRERK
jgi:hypothetical protein